MKVFLSRTVLLVLVLVAITRSAAYGAACSELSVVAFDNGWYDAGGNHTAANQSYVVGWGVPGITSGSLRNWFAFDIPVLTQAVVSAQLVIWSGGVVSPHGFETYELHHVSTPAAILAQNATNAEPIYADLGDGPVFGSRVFRNTEDNNYVIILLNAAAVAEINAKSGSSFAMGGLITTLAQVFGQPEHIFSGAAFQTVWLNLGLASSDDLYFSFAPQSQSVPALTEEVAFHTDACGSSAISYQWQFNGTNLNGETRRILRLFNVTSNNAGAYQVIATNLSGAITNSVATLEVIYQAPGATSYLAYGTTPAYIGTPITMCADISGIPYPGVQWQRNGVNVPGANSTCLHFTSVQASNAGVYTLVATNAAGSATSGPITLVVTTAPPVYAYYPFQLPPFAIGSSAYLCAATDMDPFPSFQWRLNGVNIPGATNQCFFDPDLSANDAGLYTVVATNISTAYTSPPIALTVYFNPPPPPFVYFTQGSPDALVGNDVTLCASVGGSPPLHFQWRFNDADLPGENGQCLSLLNISLSQEGLYHVVVTNMAGAATSVVFSITVRSSAPFFAQEPVSQSAVEGTTVRFRTYALAGPPATHTLFLNGTNLPVPFTFDESLSSGFTLLDATPGDAGNYYVVASNSLGMATSQVAVLTITPAGPLDRWFQRNPLPQSQNLLSLTYGNGLFAAVGERGTVVTSPDGTNWTVQGRRVDSPLSGITYGGGMFVAVGDGGTILSSADGTNWTYRYTAPLILNGVTYGNGMFVAVGAGAGQTYLVWSTNGVAWERIAVSGVQAERAIAFGNGTFVAVGGNGAIASTNGLDWFTTLFSLDDELEGVSFLQNQFMAVGDVGTVLVSSNGISWALRDTGTTRRLQSITYGNGRYITVGGRGVIFTSTDTFTWTPATSGTPDRLESVLYANNLYVAVGENGTTITSTNGTQWTPLSRGTTRDLDDVIVVNGLIVIAGKAGTILTSTNGRHYTARNASVTNDLHGIAWGNGLFVAVGEPGIIITSSNAINWTPRATGNTNSLKNAVYGNGMWVAVGTEGAVITSTDGVTWSAAVTSPPYDLNDVAYGNGRFVIAGDGQFSVNGSCFVSSNTLSWTWVNYPFEKNLRSIFFTNEIFFVTANDNRLFTSDNGVTWYPYFAYGFGNLRGAAFTHGFWTVIGNRGLISTSSNLLDWSIRPTRTFENLHGIVYLDGKFVTIGNRGTILQTERFVTELETPVPVPGVGANITVKGMLGHVYNLEATTNFVQWDLLQHFTNTTERITILDSNALTRPHQFYRAKEAP
jgi:hypothetical protein